MPAPVYELSSVMEKIIAQELSFLRENSITANFVNKDYGSDALAAKSDHVNIPVGSELEVFDVIPGIQALTSMKPSNVKKDNIRVDIDKWKAVLVEFNDKQKMEILAPAQRATIRRATVDLVQFVDREMLKTMAIGCSNIVNEPGTSIPSDPDIAFDADRLLAEHNVPEMSRTLAVRPIVAQKWMVSEKLKDLSKSGMPEVLREAQIGRLAGFGSYRTNAIYHHTAGSLTTTAPTTPTGAAVAAGSKTFVAVGTTITGDVKAGDHFRIAGIPRTFVITADKTAAANTIELNFEPALPVDAAASSALSFVQVTGYRNLAFHRDALAFVPRNPSVDTAASGIGFSSSRRVTSVTDPVSNITIAVEMTEYGMATQLWFSVLFGMRVLRPYAGCVILDVS